MSARKSWDIAPSGRKKTETPAKLAASRPSAPRAMTDMRPQRKQSAAPTPAARVSQASMKKNVLFSRASSPRTKPSEPLKKRRKEASRRLLVILLIVIVFLVGFSFYALWQPWFRITEVTASGPHADDIRALAQTKLQGSNLFIVPRSSLFFVPQAEVRSAILSAYPDIEAVSLSADGLHTLTVTALPRAQAFLWCGTAPSFADGTCYEANAAGLIFSAASPEASSTLRIYAPLQEGAIDSPIRTHMQGASALPAVLQLVKALQGLGADISSVALRSDEADLFTEGGTRITYVLGRETQAAQLAASAFPQLSLNDGSLEYVDLRFDGKIYSKKRGE